VGETRGRQIIETGCAPLRKKLSGWIKSVHCKLSESSKEEVGVDDQAVCRRGAGGFRVLKGGEGARSFTRSNLETLEETGGGDGWT